MGKWKWLNLAVRVAAGWYGYLDVFVPDSNPYEPAFRTVATVTLAGCTLELQRGKHRDRVWYQIRLEPRSCWNETTRAWLVLGAEQPVFLSGGRHRFRVHIAHEVEAGAPVALEIERWDSTRETITLPNSPGASRQSTGVGGADSRDARSVSQPEPRLHARAATGEPAGWY